MEITDPLLQKIITSNTDVLGDVKSITKLSSLSNDVYVLTVHHADNSRKVYIKIYKDILQKFVKRELEATLLK